MALSAFCVVALPSTTKVPSVSFLTRLSLKNRALIALISVVAVIFGVIGAGSLKQEQIGRAHV